ncbi:MAG: hypothetical protein ACRDY1_03050 [Acidimicrobiales bacterium]
MAEGRVHDRRFRSWDPDLHPGSRPCRLCLRVYELEPGHIETTYMHVYTRCPHCGGSFPIRHSDVDALLGGADPSLS